VVSLLQALQDSVDKAKEARVATVFETVTIPIKEHESLLRSERELIALESAGVDNWSGREYVNWNYVETGEGEPCGG
jgi:lactate dehydrogenase-like 2-hydroxyacid dehydrogenase